MSCAREWESTFTSVLIEVRYHPNNHRANSTSNYQEKDTLLTINVMHIFEECNTYIEKVPSLILLISSTASGWRFNVFPPSPQNTYQKVSKAFKLLSLKVFYFDTLPKRNRIYQNVGALSGASKIMKKLTHQTHDNLLKIKLFHFWTSCLTNLFLLHLFTIKKCVMISKRFSLLFFLKKCKNNSTSEAAIYMRITID